MKLTKYLAAAAAIVVAASLSWGAGLFQSLPILGGAAFCASSNVSGAAQGGITGQGGGVAAANQTTGTVICGVTQPAGPATFAGTELVPADIYPPGTAQIAGGAQTMLVNVTAFGQGLVFTNTGGASTTIPNNTPTFTQPAATSQTITLPSAPIHGAIQRIAVTGAQTTAFTVNANTGQTCLPACGVSLGTPAAGTGFAWYYNAPNTQWIRIQ